MYFVVYFFKSLIEVERNYDIYDKEMLFIMRFLEEWWYFLEGVREKFEILLDYKNFEYFMIVKKLNWR